MAMNRSNFRKQLQRGLHAVVGMEYKRYNEQWKEIFDVEKSEKAYEEEVLLTGFGAAVIKGEGSAITKDEGSEAWVARYYHDTVAIGFDITEEAVDDGLYGDLGARFAKAAVRSMVHTKEIIGANVLNNGFSTSYPIGDGAALLSRLHPLQGGGYGYNTLATQADLSEASLEDALTEIANFKDDRGIPMALVARKLIVPPNGVWTAERLTMSQLRPGTADNDVNAIKSAGMLPDGYVSNVRLTDTDAWFIKTDCPDGLKHFVRKAPVKKLEGDFETGNMRYKIVERYSFGVTDWRAIFGSSGA